MKKINKNELVNLIKENDSNLKMFSFDISLDDKNYTIEVNPETFKLIDRNDPKVRSYCEQIRLWTTVENFVYDTTHEITDAKKIEVGEIKALKTSTVGKIASAFINLDTAYETQNFNPLRRRPRARKARITK